MFQVLITLGLVSVQAVGALIWLVLEPPGTRMHYPSRSEVWLRCRINDTSFLVSQSYNMVLICVCTVYAFKTRKIPENFNESKFIVFTMYTTCVIWLAFLPIYFTIRHALEVRLLRVNHIQTVSPRIFFITISAGHKKFICAHGTQDTSQVRIEYCKITLTFYKA